MSRWIKVLFLLLVIAASALWVTRSFKIWRAGRPVITPNILIVSVCSMRRDMVSVYGGDGAMPALDRFFAGSSFYFANAFNPIGWTSISSYIDPPLDGKTLHDLGYDTFGRDGDLFYRVPNRRRHYPSNNEFEKDYSADLKVAEAWTQLPRVKPFIAQIHLKYMHYPLIDRYNADAEWDFFLDESERAFVKQVAASPEKFWRKLPFVLLLTGDHRVFQNHPAIRAMKLTPDSYPALEGLLSDPEMLKIWKQEPDYERDLAIVKKIYRANARHLDRVLDSVLNLWGNEQLRKHTIVMFMSDHGETHMERDLLTHGSSIFDEALAIAGAVRIPEQWRLPWSKPERIVEQFDFRAIGQWIEGLVRGQIKPEEGAGGLRKIPRTPFITRDCNYRLRGLRADNAYKYIVDTATDERYLYDLKADPKEQRNIAELQPQIAQELEAKFWELYPVYSVFAVNNCKLWPGQAY